MMSVELSDYLAQLAGSSSPGAPSPAGQGAAPQVAPGGPAAPAKASTTAPPMSTTQAAAPPAKQPGIVGSIADWWNKLPSTDPRNPAAKLKDPLEGAAVGVLRAPSQLVGGALDTASDVDRFVSDNAVGAYARATGSKAAATLQQNIAASGRGASYADTMSYRKTWGQLGNTTVNQMSAEGVGSAIPAMIPGAGEAEAVAAGVSKVAAMGQRTTLMAAGSAAALSDDPNHPIASRAKNALIGADAELGFTAVGQIAGKAYQLLKPVQKVSQATPQEAVADSLDTSFAVARTEAARTDARQAALTRKDPNASAPTQEVAPPGRHSDAQPAAGVADSPVVNPSVTDANAALEKAGAAERLPTDGSYTLTPDGRFEVAPDTKAQVDQTPYGRSFAAVNEAPEASTIYKAEDADGGQRIVYRSTPDDLQGFLNDAQKYVDNPALINIAKDDPQAASTGQWTLHPLGSPENVSAVARTLADQMQGPATVITDAQVREFAASVGENPQAFASRLAANSADGQTTLKDAVVAKVLSAKANGDISALRDRDWSSVDASHPDFVDALTKYHNGLIHAQWLQQTKSDIARALRIFGIDVNNGAGRVFGIAPEDGFQVQHVPPVEDYIRGFQEGKPPEDMDPTQPGQQPVLPRTPQEFQDALDLHDVASNYGPKAEASFWQGKTFRPDAWKYLRSSLANFFSGAIVSAPTTFARDLIGPAIMGGLQTLERTGGSLVGAFKEATIGDASKVPEMMANAAAAPQAYLRTLGDLGDSIKAGLQYIKTGEGHLGRQLNPNPLDFNTTGVPQALIDAARGDGNNTAANLYSLGNLINKFPQVVHTLHGGVNNTAIRQSYLGSVRAGAIVEALQSGLKDDALWQHVSDRVMGAQDPIGFPMDDPLYASAHNSALRTTYTKQVGDASQPILSGVNSLVQTMRNEVPETRYILPIFTVPANAIGELLRRVPVLGQTFNTTRAELAGEMGTAAQGDAYGRFLTGAGLMMGGFTLARNGVLTGGGPPNAADKAAWEAKGMRPYSINIGGNWIGYNRLDVVGAMLGIMGGAYDHTVYSDQSTGVSSHVMGGIAATAEYLKNQAALKGISDLLSFGGDPAQGESQLRMMADDTAKGFVPNFITQLARNSTDPVARIVRNPWEAIKNALPGSSTTLDPVRDTWGNDVYKTKELLGTLPLTLSSATNDPEDNELYRLMTKTGYAPSTISPALHGAHADMRDIHLEDGHSLYDHVSQARGTVTNDDGDTLKAAVHSLVGSDDYQSAPDGSEEDMQSKVGMLKSVFMDFNTRAKQQVAQDSPLAARYMAAATLKQGDAGLLGSHSATDLATPQGETLMRSLGIDYDAALDKVKGQ